MDFSIYHCKTYVYSNVIALLIRDVPGIDWFQFLVFSSSSSPLLFSQILSYSSYSFRHPCFRECTLVTLGTVVIMATKVMASKLRSGAQLPRTPPTIALMISVGQPADQIAMWRSRVTHDAGRFDILHPASSSSAHVAAIPWCFPPPVKTQTRTLSLQCSVLSPWTGTWPCLVVSQLQNRGRVVSGK